MTVKPATLFNADSVKLNAHASDREEAIRQAGDLLVASGCVAPEYVDGMLAREAVVSTYVGAGIALPHGRSLDRRTVRRSGISFVQFPSGVQWDAGEAAHIVIGLAALEEEHLTLLSNIATLLDEPCLVRDLIATRDPSLVVERLTRPIDE